MLPGNFNDLCDQAWSATVASEDARRAESGRAGGSINHSDGVVHIIQGRQVRQGFAALLLLALHEAGVRSLADAIHMAREASPQPQAG